MSSLPQSHLTQLISLQALSHHPDRRLLAYPNGPDETVSDRLQMVSSLGIEGIYTTEKQALHLLGIGYCGVVLLAQWHGQRIALKLRRIDAATASLHKEIMLLAHANLVGVGPRLLAGDRDAIAMQYLPGQGMLHWLQQAPRQHIQANIRDVLHQILQLCFQLDCQSLDHGNLSCIADHVIVSTVPGSQTCQVQIIDFSSASQARRPANVTSATQGLFIGSKLPQWLSHFHPLPIKAALIQVLRAYKHHPSEASFDAILRSVHLR